MTRTKQPRIDAADYGALGALYVAVLVWLAVGAMVVVWRLL